MWERVAFYDSKMISEQIGKSERYKDIKQVISIVITEEESIPGSPNYHHRFTMYDSVNRVELTDIIEVHTLELCRIKPEENDDRLQYWMEFIKAEGEIELETVALRDPLIRKAVVRLMELSSDEKARMLYELREKERMDIESREEEARGIGRIEGRMEGEKSTAVFIARNLLRKRIPTDEIAEVTGLSLEEVEELHNAG